MRIKESGRLGRSWGCDYTAKSLKDGDRPRGRDRKNDAVEEKEGLEKKGEGNEQFQALAGLDHLPGIGRLTENLVLLTSEQGGHPERKSNPEEKEQAITLGRGVRQQKSSSLRRKKKSRSCKRPGLEPKPRFKIVERMIMGPTECQLLLLTVGKILLRKRTERIAAFPEII